MGAVLNTGAAVGLRDDFVLTRLNSSGKLDPSFGRGGITKIELPPSPEGLFEYPLGTFVRADGSVVAGVSTTVTDHMSVIELMGFAPSGALDNTFGVRGLTIIPSPETTSVIGMVVQPSGRILVIGTTESDLVIRAFRRNGLPDSSFGVAGVKLVDLGGVDQMSLVTSTPDGAFAVGGSRGIDVGIGSLVQNIVARFNPDASVDPSFGDHGVMTLPGTQLYRIQMRSGGLDAIIVSNPGGYFTAATGFVAHYSARGSELWKLESLPGSPGMECLFAFSGKLMLGGEVQVLYTSSTGDFASTSAWALYRLIG